MKNSREALIADLLGLDKPPSSAQGSARRQRHSLVETELCDEQKDARQVPRLLFENSKYSRTVRRPKHCEKSQHEMPRLREMVMCILFHEITLIVR